MKKNVYANIFCLLIISLGVISISSCQESVLEDIEQKPTQVLNANVYPEFLTHVKSYVSSLSEEKQNYLYSVCSAYLHTGASNTETMDQIIELCNIDIVDLKSFSNLSMKESYMCISTAYSFLIPNTITRNSNCQAQRDAALRDLARKYEIELAAACITAPISGGITTAVAIVAITAITEIDRQAIHRAYDECVKNSK